MRVDVKKYINYHTVGVYILSRYRDRVCQFFKNNMYHTRRLYTVLYVRMIYEFVLIPII